MSKRRNETSQMRREEYERMEEDDEETSVNCISRRASDAEIAKRKIVVAKSRRTGPAPVRCFD